MQTFTPPQPADRAKLAELIRVLRLLPASDRQDLKDYAQAKHDRRPAPGGPAAPWPTPEIKSQLARIRAPFSRLFLSTALHGVVFLQGLARSVGIWSARVDRPGPPQVAQPAPADREAGVYLSDFGHLFDRLTEQERIEAITFMLLQIESREAGPL